MTKKLSIQRIFNILVAVLAAVVLIVYGSFRLFVFSPAYREGEREISNIVLSCRENIETRMHTISDVCGMIAYNEKVQDYMMRKDLYDVYTVSDEIRSLVNFYCATDTSVASVLAYDSEGRFRTLYGSGVTGINMGRLPYVQSCEPNEFEFIKRTNTGLPEYYCYCKNIVITATGSANYGKSVGKLYMIVRTEPISKLISGLEVSGDGFVALASNDGEILISNKENVGEKIDFADDGYQVTGLPGCKLVITDYMESNSVRSVRLVSRLTIVMLIILLLLIIGAYYLFMLKFIRPVSKITEQMDGNISLHKRIDVVTNSELDVIVGGVNSMLDRLERLTKRIVSNQQKLYEMELLNQKTSLMALQNQTNPHFLYNTLECIRSIAMAYGCKEISVISVSLSKIFRYSVRGKDIVTIREELDAVREYMKIISIRFPDKIAVEYDIDEVLLDKPCYKMIIQPIVENAVAHGIEKVSGNGKIVISVHCDGDIFVRVSDNGAGMSRQRLAAVTESLGSGADDMNSHIGLRNVNRRIELRYGKPYGVSIESSEGVGTDVTIRLPDSTENYEI